jgi:hypothetical protein
MLLKLNCQDFADRQTALSEELQKLESASWTYDFEANIYK